jgi:hypothetical protein
MFGRAGVVRDVRYRDFQSSSIAADSSFVSLPTVDGPARDMAFDLTAATVRRRVARVGAKSIVRVTSAIIDTNRYKIANFEVRSIGV